MTLKTRQVHADSKALKIVKQARVNCTSALAEQAMASRIDEHAIGVHCASRQAVADGIQLCDPKLPSPKCDWQALDQAIQLSL